ncbi:MAG: tol-pal system protein YbgF [Myxococcota bacterium]
MRIHRSRYLPGALLLALATGCVTTKEEGDLMRRDIQVLQQENRTRVEKDRELDERLAQADEKLRQIETLQKELDERSLRNKADFGAEVTALQNEVAGLRGQLETKEYQLRERELQLGASQDQVKALESRIAELQKRMDELEAKQKAAPVAEAPAQPKEPEKPAKPSFPTERQALYDFSKKAFDDGNYEMSREGFEKFLKAFPKDKELVDNAHYWIGETHFSEKHYDKAILSYQKVITDHPKSEKADAALFKMGNAFVALGYDEDAKVFYEELLQKHPKSALVKETKAKLDELKKKKKPAAKKK